MKGGYNRSLAKRQTRQEIEEGICGWQSEDGILERVNKILNNHTEEIREVGHLATLMVKKYPWELAVLNFHWEDVKDLLNE